MREEKLKVRGMKHLVGGNSGATLIEFAIASGIFFFLILGLFDFARFVIVESILTKSAQNALVVAQTTQGIDVDLRSLRVQSQCAVPNPLPTNCTTPDDQKYMQFRQGIDEVFTEARQFAFSALLHSSSVAGPLPVTAYGTTYDIPTQGQVLPSQIGVVADSLLLRPGDFGTFTDSTGATVNVSHPTLCPQSNTQPCPTNGPSRLKSSDTYEMIFQDHPLLVQMRAEVTTILPFLPTLTAVGTAIGFREPTPAGSYPGEPALGNGSFSPVCCPPTNKPAGCIICPTGIPTGGGPPVDPCLNQCSGPKPTDCNYESGIYCGGSAGACQWKCGIGSGG